MHVEHLLAQARIVLVEELLHQEGLGIARREGIHPDLVLAHVKRHRPGQTHQPGLRCRIGKKSGIGHVGMDRRNVHDAAALHLDHAGQNLARHQPRSLEIDAEHVVPVFFRHGDGIGVGVAAGIVHEPGYGTEALHRRRMHAGDVARGTHAARAEVTPAGGGK